MSAAVTIRLPYIIGGRAISHILTHFLLDHSKGLPAEIEFSFGKVQEIEPEGITFLSNTFHWLEEHGSKSRLVDIYLNSPAIRHLESAQFFEQHVGDGIGASADRIEWTLPLYPVRTSNSHAWVDCVLAPWLISRTGLQSDDLYLLQASMLELFNNITEHAKLEIGSTYAQIEKNYDGKLVIQISIADYGVGIPETVRIVAPDKVDDYDAIVEASRFGVSSKNRSGPKGAGLDQLLQSVVSQANGVVKIYSAQGIAEFSQKNNGIFAVRPFSDVGFCPGTTISLSIPVDGLRTDGETGEIVLW